MNCKCRWDGNLDGKFMRCQEHQRIYKIERAARKQADALYRELTKETDRGSR